MEFTAPIIIKFSSNWKGKGIGVEWIAMPYELMRCIKGDERYNRILKKEGIQSDEE